MIQYGILGHIQPMLRLTTRHECRRQVKKFTDFVKNVKIVEFHYHIRNHHEKCIQISTNMPGIGSVNREIAVQISEISKKQARFCSVKVMPMF